MKKSIFLFIALAFSLTFSSCKKKCPCGDDNLVQVQPADISSPTYQWEMSQAVQHSDGTMTSSISIVPNGTTSVQSVLADSVTTTIYLTATDLESGIKCITTGGGFGYTCIDPLGGVGISAHGLLANNNQCVDLTTCCLKSQRKTIENVSQHFNCTGGRVFNSGGLQIVGIIETCSGIKDTVELAVNF